MGRKSKVPAKGKNKAGKAMPERKNHHGYGGPGRGSVLRPCRTLDSGIENRSIQSMITGKESRLYTGKEGNGSQSDTGRKYRTSSRIPFQDPGKGASRR